ncbi:MAG TPA: ROK family protein [Saprospiraceae bacterium]|nr:ROK family protein [Saprospiraceae bacterium]HMQ85872.1 ROK family protein [Saprospiraceae bacterium]
MKQTNVLGIDIGASGIKGALVDINTGQLLNDRIRLETPKPSTPEAMAKVVQELIRLHDYEGVVGCGFPAIVKKGVAHSAANIDKSWMHVNIEQVFSETCGMPFHVLNDADAAGQAEITFGHGSGKDGTVVMITIGTGLGSALFMDGRLLPNTEFGHIEMHGAIAERYASSSARERENLDWEVWGKRFDEYLHYLNLIINPDFILLGGGGSKDFKQYQQYLTVEIPVEPAYLLNAAGIVGAAAYAMSLEL